MRLRVALLTGVVFLLAGTLWIATRLGGEGGRTLGTLPEAVDSGAIVRRAWPAS